MSIVNEKRLVLGIDIGGTNFRVGLVNSSGKVVSYKVESSNVLEAGEKDSLENLVKYIEEFLSYNLDGVLGGIAIGFPSTVSKDKRMVYSTPNLGLKGFENMDISDYIGNKIHVPVFINRDVNFLLAYDLTIMNLNKKSITLGFYIGTGFGNSIYINDEFLDGKNGVAGELGHIPTLNVKTLCGCGNEGCAEVYASGTALRKINEEFFPDTFIGDIFVKHRDDDRIRQYVDGLTIPIATEINIFDPDNIIIGGGIPAMKGFPRSYLEKCIKHHTRKPYPSENLNILYSNNRQECGVIGAALYTFMML